MDGGVMPFDPKGIGLMYERISANLESYPPYRGEFGWNGIVDGQQTRETPLGPLVKDHDGFVCGPLAASVRNEIKRRFG